MLILQWYSRDRLTGERGMARKPLPRSMGALEPRVDREAVTLHRKGEVSGEA